MQEENFSQGRESFGREHCSRGALRDVLCTGAAEGGKAIHVWISQARKLIPAQGEGKTHISRREIPPPPAPCSATSTDCAYSQNQKYLDQSCFKFWGLEPEMGEWNRRDLK